MSNKANSCQAISLCWSEHQCR